MNTTKESQAPAITEQKMTSIRIAEISGKNHRDVMRAIRNMEPSWEKINGRNFALIEYTDKLGRKKPMYELDWKECMFIGSKFNDEARAIIITEWAALKEKQFNQKEILRLPNYGRITKDIDEKRYTEIRDLICEASVVLGSQKNLAIRLGITEKTITKHMRSDTGFRMVDYFKIKNECRKIIGLNKTPEPDYKNMMGILLKIEDTKERLLLFNKLQEGGLI